MFDELLQTVNTDIFKCIPNSYGTLGFLTAVDIKILPAKKYITLKYRFYLSNIQTVLKSFRYVKLKYRPIRSLEKIESRLIAETRDLENNDFVELIIYNRDEGVLTTGKMTDGDNNDTVIKLRIVIIVC